MDLEDFGCSLGLFIIFVCGGIGVGYLILKVCGVPI